MVYTTVIGYWVFYKPKNDIHSDVKSSTFEFESPSLYYIGLRFTKKTH